MGCGVWVGVHRARVLGRVHRPRLAGAELWILGLWVQFVGFMDYGLVFWVQWAQGSEFRVKGVECWVQGVECRVQGVGCTPYDALGDSAARYNRFRASGLVNALVQNLSGSFSRVDKPDLVNRADQPGQLTAARTPHPRYPDTLVPKPQTPNQTKFSKPYSKKCHTQLFKNISGDVHRGDGHIHADLHPEIRRVADLYEP